MFKGMKVTLIVATSLVSAVASADAADWAKHYSTHVTGLMPVPAMKSAAQIEDTYTVFGELEFQDSSAVGRASNIRSLSLLTLAEFGKSRLFLGVDKRGLIGLHFNVTRRRGDDRCLEVARMPYLRRSTAD